MENTLTSLTSCGGTSKETVLRSTLVQLSMHGRMKNIPANIQHQNGKRKHLCTSFKIIHKDFIPKLLPTPPPMYKLNFGFAHTLKQRTTKRGIHFQDPELSAPSLKCNRPVQQEEATSLHYMNNNSLSQQQLSSYSANFCSLKHSQKQLMTWRFDSSRVFLKG